MNENQARHEGYLFTGAYSRDRKEMKVIAEKEKKEGYLTVIVTIPDSPYSRGTIGKGYSVYRKPTDKKIKEIEETKQATVKKRFDDNNKIIGYISSRNKEELIQMFIEAKGEDLLKWAREKNII